MSSSTPPRWHVTLLLVLGVTLAAIAAPVRAEASGEEVRRAAESLGFSPQSLSIAGITQPAEITALLQRLADASTAIDALNQARAAFDQVGGELTSLRALLAAGSGDEGVAQQYQAAMLAYDNAIAAFDQAVAGLRVIAVNTLDQATIESLDIWWATRHYAVPAAFRVDLRSDAEWKAIASALRSEQRAARMDQPLDPVHEQLLNAVRGETTVINATYDLTTHLATVTQAFDEFTPES